MSSELPKISKVPSTSPQPPVASAEIPQKKDKITELAKDTLQGLALVAVSVLGRRKVGGTILRKSQRQPRAPAYPALTPAPPAAPMKSGLREAAFRTIEHAKTSDLPPGYFDGSGWLGQAVKRETAHLQSIRQMRTEAKATDIASAKGFLRAWSVGATAFLVVATAAFAFYNDRSKAKISHYERELNKDIDQLNARRREFEMATFSIMSDRESVLQSFEQEMTDEIDQSSIPDTEKKQLIADMGHLVDVIRSARVETEQEISDFLSQWQEIEKYSPPSESVAQIKEASIHLTAAIVGLATGFLITRIPYARGMLRELSKAGMPKAVIEKFLIGSVMLVMQETFAKVFQQTMTGNQLSYMASRVSEKLTLDVPARSKEQKVDAYTSNITLGMISKALACAIPNPFSEVAETLSQSFLKAVCSDHIEEAVLLSQLRREIDQNLTPVHHQLTALEGNVRRLERSGETELREFKQVFDTIKAQHQPKAQSSSPSLISWLASKLSFI